MHRRKEGSTRPSHLRLAVAASVLAIVAGCNTTESSERRDYCEEIGWIYYAIAELRDRGETRHEQIVWAYHSLSRPETREVALAIIDRVYETRKSPTRLSSWATRNCSIRPATSDELARKLQADDRSD